MGHYDEQYAEEEKRAESWRATRLEALKKRFPSEYALAKKFKEEKEAYDLFKNCM